MDKALVPYWEKEVSEARELIAASKGVANAFVGLSRAQAFVSIDEELTLLRSLTAHLKVGTVLRYWDPVITPRPLEEGRAVKGQDVSDVDVARGPDATLDSATSEALPESSRSTAS
jgi:hypothetical protein